MSSNSTSKHNQIPYADLESSTPFLFLLWFHPLPLKFQTLRTSSCLLKSPGCCISISVGRCTNCTCYLDRSFLLLSCYGCIFPIIAHLHSETSYLTRLLQNRISPLPAKMGSGEIFEGSGEILWLETQKVFSDSYVPGTFLWPGTMVMNMWINMYPLP